MNELFQEILEIGNSNLTNDQKHQKLSYLWTAVFKKPNLPIMIIFITCIL